MVDGLLGSDSERKRNPQPETLSLGTSSCRVGDQMSQFRAEKVMGLPQVCTLHSARIWKKVRVTVF